MSEIATYDPSERHGGMARACLFAAAWAFAEATCFFIVPDVLLTRIALRDWRRAVIAATVASVAAAAGGIILWALAQHGFAATLLAGMRWLPGINDRLIDSAHQLLSAKGALGLFAGMVRGQPYKIFAVHAGVAHLPLLGFVGVSLMARYARFAATSAVAALARRLLRNCSDTFFKRLHLAVWTLFYGVYFAVMR